MFRKLFNFSISIIWFIPLFAGIQTKAQTKLTENLEIHTNLHYGYMLPEYKFVNYLVNDNIHAYEVCLEKRTTGGSPYEQIYKYPSYGISFMHSTLGNDEVFGKSTALFPYYVMHLLDREKFGVNYQMGVGLCYASKKYDIEDNYQNIAMGSHVNVFYNLKVAARAKLLKKLSIETGMAFNHLSNANMQAPNLGLNYITAYMGANYAIGQKTDRINNTIAPLLPKTEFVIAYAHGMKKPRSLEDKSYYVTSLSLEANRKQFRKFHFGAGLDFFYDSSMESEFYANEKSKYKPQYDYRTGIHISQEFVYDRLSLIIQEGFYVLLTDKLNNKPMYNRAIVRYKFTKHWMANVSMKSHLHILDYPEFGLGYYW